MKPFLAGRPTIDGPALRPAVGPEDTSPLPTAAGVPNARNGAAPGNPAMSGHAHAPAASASGPTVECIKQGDKVVRLVITCSCGERIEVECLYPAGG